MIKSVKDVFTKGIILVTKNLRQLGNKIIHNSNPDKAIIEKVINPHKKENYVIRFSIPEFTSLCPVTGQPDFAHLIIDYIPRKVILESKSLKLFLGSFRSQAGFCEECTVNIAKRIENEVKPRWIRIGGFWNPRGGIPIDVFYQSGKVPDGTWIPDYKAEFYQPNR